MAESRASIDTLLLAALSARAARWSGPVGDRLAVRLAQQRSRLAARQPATERLAVSTAPTDAPAHSALAQLALRHPARPMPADGTDTRMPPLRALDQFRDSWAALRLEQQVADTLARAPRNAGPLNTQRLVARVLLRLRDLSPAYLQHFMDHLDALAGLEALLSPRAPGATPVPPATPERKPTRKTTG